MFKSKQPLANQFWFLVFQGANLSSRHFASVSHRYRLLCRRTIEYCALATARIRDIHGNLSPKYDLERSCVVAIQLSLKMLNDIQFQIGDFLLVFSPLLTMYYVPPYRRWFKNNFVPIARDMCDSHEYVAWVWQYICRVCGTLYICSGGSIAFWEGSLARSPQ